MEGERMSIYRAARTIKRKDNSIYNALRSIYQDSIFVGEISLLWPQLPLLANLRCGLWYSNHFHSNCYFKSTDGHYNNWSFNTSRLNLHVPLLSAQKGGCMIVDSTRKGKKFPDSMSKTIPIWTCVLNRAIFNYRKNNKDHDVVMGSNISDLQGEDTEWDCSLHLPRWIPETEKSAIEDRLEGWTKELEESGADIATIATSLKKPLRPLWISQNTVIWLNEVPEHDSWDFTPIILVTASSSSGIVPQRSNNSEYSWNYIPGAGDDEESWARGLTPNLFWNHEYDIISSGPELCNKMVAEIVEKDRVYRAQRGQDAPQLPLKFSKLSIAEASQDTKIGSNGNCLDNGCTVSWLGSTNLAAGDTQLGNLDLTILV